MRTADAFAHPNAGMIKLLLAAGYTNGAIAGMAEATPSTVQAIRSALFPAIPPRAPRQKLGTVAVNGPPPDGGVSFATALEDGGCLWALGPLLAKAEKFCGRPRLYRSGSYCPDHYRIAVPPLEEERPIRAAAQATQIGQGERSPLSGGNDVLAAVAL